MGLHEMIIDAEEALDAIEGADLLDRVLIALRVRLLLGSISAEVEEGEARVEEVGHFGLLGPPGAPRWPLGTPRRRRGLRGRARAGSSFELSETGASGTASRMPRGRWMAFTGCLRNSWQRLAAEVASDELRAQNLRRLDNLASVD